MENYEFIKIGLIKETGKRPSKGYAVVENDKIYICGHNKELDTQTNEVTKKHGMKFATATTLEISGTLDNAVNGLILTRGNEVFKVTTNEKLVNWAFDPTADPTETTTETTTEETTEETTTSNNNNKTTEEMNTTATNNNSIENGILSLLQNEVNKQVAEKTAQLENEYKKKIEELENNSETKEINHTYTIKTNNTENTIETGKTPLTKHFNFICELVANDENVYLWGAAGNGKTHTAIKVGEVLGLKTYVQSALLNDYDIDGYLSADGRYIPSLLYTAMTEGGLLVLDDFTTGDGRACNKLLDVLANRVHCFPVVGMVKAHKDFRIIATDNTSGNGATAEYNQRDQFDAALLDRFGFKLKMQYEIEIENALAPTTAPFGRCFRYAADDKIISYRILQTLEKSQQYSDLKEVVKCTILNGCNNLQLQQYKQRIKFAPEFEKIKETELYKAFDSISESEL